MNSKLNAIVKNFKIGGVLTGTSENSQGNINSSYLLSFNEGGVTKKYLMQKINSSVFKNPYQVMKNIELVTTHIKKKLRKIPNCNHKTLTLVPTLNDEFMYVYTNSDGEKEYYRIYEYIDNCISYNNFSECSNKEEIAYNAGRCLGFFHKLLNDFPVNSLHETIPDFHNTPKRFQDLMDAIESNITRRAFEHSEEIVYFISKIKEYSEICNNLGKTIPMRVTHNDTKLNNILMDANTHEGIAVIDLDTVMPGVDYDLGDAIRSGGANAFEDETDPEKIYLNLDLTKAYIKGYLEEMAKFLTFKEASYICLSIKTVTYELAMRFLTDYINGDPYFKIKYPEHNKDRFKNQYILLRKMEDMTDELHEFIMETYLANK